MKTKLRKNFWKFIKRFPVLTYALLALLSLVIFSQNDFFLFVSFPFIPALLIYGGGLGSLFSLDKFIVNEAAYEIVTVVIFILICLTIDLLTHLLHKTITNLFGQNFLTKITTIILTLILWIIVFISLINSLPIDT